MRRRVHERVPPADARGQTVGCKCDVLRVGPQWEREDFFPWSWADVVRGHKVSHFPVDELIEFLRGSRNAGLHLFVNTTRNNGFCR